MGHQEYLESIDSEHSKAWALIELAPCCCVSEDNLGNTILWEIRYGTVFPSTKGGIESAGYSPRIPVYLQRCYPAPGGVKNASPYSPTGFALVRVGRGKVSSPHGVRRGRCCECIHV